MQGAGILRNADIAEWGKLSKGNLPKIKCGTFHKLPVIAFPHSAAEKFRISAVARIVQLMCSRSIATSGDAFLPYSLWSVCQRIG